jgi:farnesyl-diphosphate farnesyltransferase
VPNNEVELFESVLAAVSRSFYLTIRALPAGLRRPVGLAYLLARTSDTIADSASASEEVRLRALRQFGDAIHGTGTGLTSADIALLETGIPDPAERALLARTATLIDLLQATEQGDGVEIVRVLDEILKGQMLDLERFARGGGLEIRALASAAELDAYTYSVAGCVGEFWTRICIRHLNKYARESAVEMERLGLAFGKGLQLVNILRDLPADLAIGRCYLPSGELEALGLNPAALKNNPALARPVFEQWLRRARGLLDEGFLYIVAVKPWRLRLACFLPWAVGMKTLALLEQTPSLETAQRVKVSRREIKTLVRWGILAAASNAVLRWYGDGLKKILQKS